MVLILPLLEQRLWWWCCCCTPMLQQLLLCSFARFMQMRMYGALWLRLMMLQYAAVHAQQLQPNNSLQGAPRQQLYFQLHLLRSRGRGDVGGYGKTIYAGLFF